MAPHAASEETQRLAMASPRLLQPANDGSGRAGRQLASTTPAVSYTLKITNNNATLIPSPYVTFTSTGMSYTDSQGATKQISAYTSVPLSDIQNAEITVSSTAIGGDFYISDKKLQYRNSSGDCADLSSGHPVAPSPVSPTDCNIDTRWQFVEVGGDYDLTYINLFSVPLALTVGGTQYGNATAAEISALKTALGNLTEPAGAAIHKDSNGNFIRAVSPANAGSPDSKLLKEYPSFASYLANRFTLPESGGHFSAIKIDNTYSGPGVTNANSVCTVNDKAFQTQDYSATAYYISLGGERKYLSLLWIFGSADKVGDFAITGVRLREDMSGVAACGGSTGPSYCYTTQVRPEDLNQAFYTAVMSYTVDNESCPAFSQMLPIHAPKIVDTVESNGANDVFSTVVRDFLVGFAGGFVGSPTAAPQNPTGAATYGTMTSGEWSSLSTELFGGLQPHHSYYNPWGAAIYGTFNSEVYGFQYSDYFSGPLGNPLMQVNAGDTVEITILDESQ
ncbi:beta-1,3-glucanase family protein [Nisaea acidiphila]|uniref:Beta-1,3-glucanase family protein n=1 Tax=Nisaea acidiphila TaxID=1862145 RepID=A0A9J7ATU3_9PROT|nr:beta-1,3-glucanase family protein [Nisaea acidiphila]UUX48797.1 beta-1,3-glucanase family protein [Nisaea acidiphila]